MKIIAATDGTPTSAAALRFAARMASATRGRLTVLTVRDLPPPGIGGDARRGRGPLDEARRVIRGLAGTAPVAFELLTARRDEPFADVVSRAADRRGADLLVVGTAGGSPLRRWLLGSVGYRLVHVATRPVAVVRGGSPGAASKLSRILVATDGSRPASRAVRYAARLASAIPGASLVILTVSTLSADLALTGSGIVRRLGLLPELERADRRAAMKILSDASRLARGKRVTTKYYQPERRILAGRAILEEARRQRADLVVVGRTGRTAFGDVMMGSVAQRVVALSRRPVVLVPGAGSGKPA